MAQYKSKKSEKQSLLSVTAVAAFCLIIFFVSNQFDKYYSQCQHIDYKTKDTLVVTQAVSDISGIVSASVISKDKNGNRHNDLFRGNR